MALSDEKVRGYVRRLLVSRMRILCNHGFFGLLLMHMKYAVDEHVPTACTDGIRIIFGTDFLERLSDDELDFVMLHEIMHVVLKHCERTGDFDNNVFNIACDIVVNSNILHEAGGNLSKITLKDFGEAMHIAPDGKEGFEYTAEQVYYMLLKNAKKTTASGSSKGKDGKGKSGASVGAGDSFGEVSWDSHDRWGKGHEEDDALSELWDQRIASAIEAIEIKDSVTGRGTMPLLAKRVIEDLKKPQTDWRTILNDFVCEEVNDYSFNPPDRRFDDSPFFLPDFNEKDERVEKILFMIDTSGSMSDDMITTAYSEIKGAIDQFDGKLCGWLGFFDAEVVDPIAFDDIESFMIIRPKGGGGTSFEVIFDYVRDKMADDPPVSIIILTDGYAPFPDESVAMDIPVLWIINNESVEVPWGKVARIK